MPTITANTSPAISLLAGQSLVVNRGTGMAAVLVGPARYGNVHYGLQPGRSIGPFDVPVTLSVTASDQGLDYTLGDSRSSNPPLSNDELTLFRGPISTIVSGASFLWANRPSAAANPGLLINVSDIGGGAGTLFRSDGTNWYPVGGRVLLLNRTGSVTTPVVSITGPGGAVLAGAPLSGIKIPAGLIIPGRTRMLFEAYWVKASGSANQFNCITFVGKNNSTSDSQLGGQQVGAVTGVWRQFTELYFDTTTSATETNSAILPGAVAGATVNQVRNTNIDTTVDMYVNYGSSINTAGDVLALYSVAITLFQ